MVTPVREVEGTWEEMVALIGHISGQKLRVLV